MMLLNTILDDKLKENFKEQGISLKDITFFIYACTIASIGFMVISFFLFNTHKELSSPYFIGAISYLILPVTLKWLKQTALSLLAFPIISQLTLIQLCLHKPSLQEPHFLWLMLIPYFSMTLTGQTFGLIFSSLAFLTVTVTKIITMTPQGYSDFFTSLTLWAFPYFMITYLCWHYRDENEKSKILTIEKKKLANESQKTKDTFWGNISHEVRTPLNGILGMTHLLSESELKGEQQELLNIIRGSAENLNIVLSDIIDYSKLEMNKIEENKQVFHLSSCLDQIIALFSHHARKNKVHLSYIIDPDVPVGLYADSERIKQVLINLVSNALKFTESGSVKIIVERFDRKETLRFSVEDTGIGVAEDKKDKLFSPFTQIDADKTRKYGGTGLGLVICAKIVELLGGHIEVEPIVGHGSIFSFTLTAIPARALAPYQDTQKVTHHYLAKKVALNILVVEDNPVNQKLLVTLLKKNGHKPDVASDGLEALEACKHNNYHLIFMDIQMPRMDGITATEKILEQNCDHPPKIIAVTANALQEDRDKCFQAGMDDFLTKPINNYVLSSILKRYSERIVDHNQVTSETKQHDQLPQPERAEPLVAPTFSVIKYKSFDASVLLGHYDHDKEIITSLGEEFKRRYAKELSLMELAAGEKDYMQLAAVAHSMKGSLMSLQSSQGKRIAMQIEESANQHHHHRVYDLIAELTEHCEKLVEELDHFTSAQDVA